MRQRETQKLRMGGAWFDRLTETRRALVLAHGRLKRLREGELLYAIGDPPNGLYGVVAGEVRLINYPTFGAQRLNFVVGAGEWFGELSVLDGGPRPHEAVCTDRTQVLFLSLAAIDAIALREPGFYRDIALIACQHQRMQTAVIGRMLCMPPSALLAYALLNLVATGDAGEPGGTRLETNVSQEGLASLLGMSRQTISRLLKRLEARKILRIGYSRLLILDLDELAREACLEPGEPVVAMPRRSSGRAPQGASRRGHEEPPATQAAIRLS